MNIPFLDLSKMDSELKNALKLKFGELLDKGRFSGGEEVESFENNVSTILNSPHVISCANGTDALELALRALNIGAGDEVIVPALTWVSTAEAVIMVGAKPVFWDTDRNGLLADDWTKAISSRTKAVIPVHLYGKMPNMDFLMKKAKESNLFVIEDAAQAFGSFQKRKAAGTWGDVGCLSFYPTKNLGALGEAGICLTNDSKLATRIRLLSNHGQPARDQHELVGRNSRIDTIQAGFLNVFFEKLPAFQKKRKTLAAKYDEQLKSISEIQLPNGSDFGDCNLHLYVIQSKKRDLLRAFLEKKGIKTAIHYPEIVPDLKPYKVHGDFEMSRSIAKNGLSLPLNPWLKEEEITFIISKICEFFKS
ncbi:DegT/DnrJ/EryC1/StrS aminotransferase family protein [Algoriphagus sp.]|uniref:DegT/DnrJ/EryC1/StrS family aminotransferase n=1 Tax=Algoriphagus sp. TaxID=1872435 RepID=UPI0025E07470|nr:DegT/DnrJ/EryC1/StrS family aminotransferase [Algoriphagus sp.]